MKSPLKQFVAVWDQIREALRNVTVAFFLVRNAIQINQLITLCRNHSGEQPGVKNGPVQRVQLRPRLTPTAIGLIAREDQMGDSPRVPVEGCEDAGDVLKRGGFEQPRIRVLQKPSHARRRIRDTARL